MAAVTATHVRAASDASSDAGSDADFHDAVSGLAAADGVDIDAPPAFPALNSAQRSGGGGGSGSNAQAGPSRIATAGASSSAGPSFSVSGPASGAARGASKGSSPAAPAARSSLRAVLGVPPASSSSSGGASSLLAAPPRTSALTAPPGVGGAGGARIGGSGGGGLGVPKAGGLGVPTETGGGARRKVALAPGCSPLDWAREKASGKPELRAGLTSLQRITPSELAKHNTRDDAWSAFHGKVYNLTPYLRFHPGGEKEALRVAGRDGTRLFMLTHSWVNIDAMIDTTMVGMLVPEP